jgi:uncharacterized protein YndB with AHSA1/START domain
MSKWFGCGMTTSVLITQDFRVGGEYRIACHCQDDELATMHGTFMEIEPNRKLVYSWNNTSTEYPANDTLVTVEFIDNGDTTEIVLQHTKFATALSAEGHSFGWNAALDKIAELFAQ